MTPMQDQYSIHIKLLLCKMIALAVYWDGPQSFDKSLSDRVT